MNGTLLRGCRHHVVSGQRTLPAGSIERSAFAVNAQIFTAVSPRPCWTVIRFRFRPEMTKNRKMKDQRRDGFRSFVGMIISPHAAAPGRSEAGADPAEIVAAGEWDLIRELIVHRPTCWHEIARETTGADIEYVIHTNRGMDA